MYVADTYTVYIYECDGGEVDHHTSMNWFMYGLDDEYMIDFEFCYRNLQNLDRQSEKGIFVLRIQEIKLSIDSLEKKKRKCVLDEDDDLKKREVSYFM